jgi:putative two-component system response regulator
MELQAGNAVEPVASMGRVLVVDDHEPTLQMLSSLARHGLGASVRGTTDSRDVLALFAEFEPDLLLLDLHMPGLDGLALVEQVRQRVTHGEFLPIVMFSGDASPQARQRALELGASDFIAKPIVPAEVTLRLQNLLRLRRLTCRLEQEVQSRLSELRNAELDVANRLAMVAEFRDYPDGSHVQRVGQLSSLIARELGLPDNDVLHVRYAAPLHDLGKVSLPDTVLLKPSRLDAAEFALVRAHTTTGARMLAGSRSPILQLAETIAQFHHENWDGTGYPAGLAGENIPAAGRIVRVADAFDALTHHRPYKAKWTMDEAMTWMESMRGRNFDPRALDALLSILGDGRLPHGDDAVIGAAIVTAGANRSGAITSRTLPTIHGIGWDA